MCHYEVKEVLLSEESRLLYFFREYLKSELEYRRASVGSRSGGTCSLLSLTASFLFLPAPHPDQNTTGWRKRDSSLAFQSEEYRRASLRLPSSTRCET